ncbi:uncharacterized protein LOC105279345 [Ooceraea biroi]|uniref:uncharacterized protein LOC105279345 n=1 Tax=Ooceraea biroi TaxID=2015173 RepID=UPI000F08A640|nr:uncharacterized protein LOC105279345 [Ooceraea biroi]
MVARGRRERRARGTGGEKGKEERQGGKGTTGGVVCVYVCGGLARLRSSRIKSVFSLRQKCRTIYKKVKWTPFWTLLETNFDELLIATSMYVYSSSYLTYSVPFTTVWYALFIQPDGAIITTWWYINIFSDGAWTVSFVFGMCIACSIIGVQRVKKLTCINKKHFDDEFSSPFFNILYVLGGMTGQGLQKVPRDLSMRIIALALLMMGMLLSYGFSSTLTSCLTSKGNSVAITNLEDVETKRSHSLCMRNNSGAYGYFTVVRKNRNKEKMHK